MDYSLNSESKYKRIYKIALLFIVAIIAIYLIVEHQAHLVAYSGTIFFIIFILMHFFMHRGHGGHGGHGKRDEGQHEHNNEPEEKQDIDKVGEPQDASLHEYGPEENKL